MNDDTNFPINIMHLFNHQMTMIMYLQEHKYDSSKTQSLSSYKYYIGFIIKEIKEFEWQVSLLFFVLNNKKLSQHMAQISERINYTNQKNHSYDQI